MSNKRMKNIAKIILLATAFSFNVLAASNDKPSTSTVREVTKDIDQSVVDGYQKVIDDFKKYMLSVKPEIKEEIKEFRQKIKELNEHKTKIYNELTIEAQNYLKQEREFKNKLPFKQRKDFVKDAKEALGQNQVEEKDNKKEDKK
jgi:maltose-binding protein MalE